MALNFVHAWNNPHWSDCALSIIHEQVIENEQAETEEEEGPPKKKSKTLFTLCVSRLLLAVHCKYFAGMFSESSSLKEARAPTLDLRFESEDECNAAAGLTEYMYHDNKDKEGDTFLKTFTSETLFAMHRLADAWSFESACRAIHKLLKEAGKMNANICNRFVEIMDLTEIEDQTVYSYIELCSHFFKSSLVDNLRVQNLTNLTLASMCLFIELITVSSPIPNMVPNKPDLCTLPPNRENLDHVIGMIIIWCKTNHCEKKFLELIGRLPLPYISVETLLYAQSFAVESRLSKQPQYGLFSEMILLIHTITKNSTTPIPRPLVKPIISHRFERHRIDDIKKAIAFPIPWTCQSGTIFFGEEKVGIQYVHEEFIAGRLIRVYLQLDEGYYMKQATFSIVAGILYPVPFQLWITCPPSMIRTSVVLVNDVAASISLPNQTIFDSAGHSRYLEWSLIEKRM